MVHIDNIRQTRGWLFSPKCKFIVADVPGPGMETLSFCQSRTL